MGQSPLLPSPEPIRVSASPCATPQPPKMPPDFLTAELPQTNTNSSLPRGGLGFEAFSFLCPQGEHSKKHPWQCPGQGLEHPGLGEVSLGMAGVALGSPPAQIHQFHDFHPKFAGWQLPVTQALRRNAQMGREIPSPALLGLFSILPQRQGLQPCCRCHSLRVTQQ